jgi:hypothetical protein
LPPECPQVAKIPLFTVFRSKTCVNTSTFWDQPAKNAVLYRSLQCYFPLPSKTLVFAVFGASLV